LNDIFDGYRVMTDSFFLAKRKDITIAIQSSKGKTVDFLSQLLNTTVEEAGKGRLCLLR
jgi:hypothetical protein